MDYKKAGKSGKGYPCPVRVISQNTEDLEGGSDQRSSSWVVGIVRYIHPVSNPEVKEGVTPPKDEENKTSMVVIQSDVISVNIQNNKKSFGKMCNLALKTTNFWYPSKVSPGDWVFVWMQDSVEAAERIARDVENISKLTPAGSRLVGPDSGLKFVGRVVGVNASDSVSPSGRRVLNVGITAQGFLEFATSVFYTASAQALLNELSQAAGENSSQLERASIDFNRKNWTEEIQFDYLEDRLKKLAKTFKDYSIGGTGDPTPDVIIALYYILIMGITGDGSANDVVEGVKGTYNSGIHLPPQVSLIFKGNTNAKKLWEITDVVLGIQQYATTDASNVFNNPNWYKSFTPKLAKTEEGVFKKTNFRTRGFVVFRPTLWQNENVWSILNQNLNPVCNEMYTSLRINSNGKIVPTLTVREKPFGTGLFNKFTQRKLDPLFLSRTRNPVSNPIEVNEPQDLSQTLDIFKTDIPLPSKKEVVFSTQSKLPRSMYGNLPRWIIMDNMVRSYNYGTNEANRVNFVQVWGRSEQQEFLGLNINVDIFMAAQFAQNNFFFDEKDIARNGLRAYIATSNYDVYFNESRTGNLKGGFAQEWARMNADWLFNGHLKYSATLVTNGIVDPVTEGDNLEYRGILYHIESVTHSASIGANGAKTWTTTFQLSNGVIADSLRNPDSVPLYPGYQPEEREKFSWPDAPGLSYDERRVGG